MDFERLVPIQMPVDFQKNGACAGAGWSRTFGAGYRHRHRHFKHLRFGGMVKGSYKTLSSQGPHDQYLAQSDLAQDTKKLQQRESGQFGPGPITNKFEKK